MWMEVRGRHRHRAVGLPQGSDNVGEDDLKAARGTHRLEAPEQGGSHRWTGPTQGRVYFGLGLKPWAESRSQDKIG